MDAPTPPLRSPADSSGLQRNHKVALLVGGGVLAAILLVSAFLFGGGKKATPAPGNSGPVAGQPAPGSDVTTIGAGGAPGTSGASGGGADATTFGNPSGLDVPATSGGGTGAGSSGLGNPTPVAGGPIGGSGGRNAGTPGVIPGATPGSTTPPGAGVAAGGPGATGARGLGTPVGGTATSRSPAPGSVPAGNLTAYKVQAGDTLWVIAKKTYGDGRVWPVIAAANPNIDPAKIHEGMMLKLPPPDYAAGVRTAATRSTAGATAAASGGHPAAATRVAKSVTVKDGDTLYAIARRELGDGEKWDLIYNANKSKIKNPDEITVGLTLTIPGT